MTKILRVLFLISAFSHQLAWSADLPALTKLFEKHFWDSTIYQDGRCGMNIMRFIQLARSIKIDLSNMQILGIEDKGMNSLEGAHPYVGREEGNGIQPTPTAPPFRHTGSAEWFHHYVLYVDGYVIDFDYTNKPTVVPLRYYMFHMFMNPNHKDDLEKIKNGVGKYELEFETMDKQLVKKGLFVDLYPEWFKELPGCYNQLISKKKP